MNELQARTLRESRDSYVKMLSRQSRHSLACMYRVELADRGMALGYGGPASKDEFISALVELRYPRAKMNESLHVLYHQEFTSEVCEFCNPDPCPVCGALSTCEWVDGLGAVVNGRHVPEWDFAKAALSARLTDG